MRQPSNKALAVLALLREDWGERSCQEIADEITRRTPCSECDGVATALFDPDRCRSCYGRGYRLFSYSTAYVALKQLKARGLVRRRYLTDEWGDVTPKLVWWAEVDVPGGSAVPGTADELEAQFRLPAAERS